MDRRSPGVVIGLLVLAFEAFLATFTIVFIICVILRDFHKKKRLDTKDKIQMALKVSSFIFTSVVTYNEFSNIVQPQFSKVCSRSPLYRVLIVYSMCSCSWLIAVQCFFYFIKIVHVKWISSPWVRMNISSIVSWQIVLVKVISLCISLFDLISYKKAHVSSMNTSCISSTNTTRGEMLVNDYVPLFILIIVGAPLVLSIIAISLNAAFLSCHMNKMKTTKTSGEVHQYKRIVFAMLRFLFLYFIFYVVMFLHYFSYFALYSIGYWLNLILVLSFIPVLYILQIRENPQWRATCKEMTSYFTHCGEPNTD
ncbi:taste receptor type 2 member 9-like [Bufo gargarizans]|uniref:taste receptor type 2 member 9-like n=1 Tax=Bufo gargarizans TaxID=30331 RepID=UPI001CF15BCD|nr:taste receptor type 2 member 9-like [Bufo gargarizans]